MKPTRIATFSIITAFICASLTIKAAGAQTRQPFEEKSLSPFEQELFNEINQTRAHPHVYVAYLEKLKPCERSGTKGRHGTQGLGWQHG